MNDGILFLGGAKRVAMARLFMKAAAERSRGCRIFSYELRADEPIASVGTVIIGRRWNDPEVVEDIRRVCRENGIGIVVPFVDGAVEVAARVRDTDIFVPTGCPGDAEAMFDKVRAAEIFELMQIPAPATYKGGAVVRPLIAKPRHGSASKGIIKVDSEADLPANREDYLIQDRFDYREEISIDCYVREDFVPTAIVPRKRLEVAGGEVVRSVTIDCPEAVELARLTIAKLKLLGAVTIQLIRDVDTGKLHVMEINPRLGGGAVCAVHAGADIPGMILDEAAGILPAPSSYRPGTEIARYMQEVVFYLDEDGKTI